MEFNADYLNEVLSKEDTTTEEKIQLILSEHEADKRGVADKNYELIGNEKKLKEKIASFEENEKSYADKISNLEAELKKNSAEEHRKYYDSQLESKQKEYDKSVQTLTAERDFYKASHIKRMQDDAIVAGIDGLQFRDDTHKKFFIRAVLTDNDFEAKDIDGTTVFVNKNNITLQDVLKNYATTAEGKECLKPLTSGGGAQGGKGSGGNSKQLSRAEFEALDAQGKQDFFHNGGQIV